ncbi:MAG TPA: molybdopterin-dependent oxidoreductase [Candidatus Binataceae bacterium]|nr:molybdopterin-dependent oxidoreductase [Candidatus Binataceae bacterium]
MSDARNGAEFKPVICVACSQQCGVIVRLEGGRVTGITGDKEHPVSRGFICVKGSQAPEFHYRDDRVHWPLKRVGARGEDRWERIEWEQAIEEIARKIRELRDRYGAESIAVSTGTLHGADWGMGERFLNLLGSPNMVGQDKVCTGPIAIGEALTSGYGPSGYTPPIPGITGCIVLWGFRPAAGKPLAWKQIVQAMRSGTKLIVVDPLRTLEARQSALFVQLRPGSDCALALGWLNVIISEGLYDREFVAGETIGFEALRERAAEYTPARVAELTWVPESLIVESARTFARSGPAILAPGNGLCQIGATSVQAARALACIVAITGNLNRRGGHMVIGPPHKIVANGDAIMMDRLSDAQRDKRLGADRFTLLNGDSYRLFADALGRAWFGKRHIFSIFTSAHEPMLWDAIVDQKPYPVKALITQYHNPLGGSPNAHKVAAALKHPNLELSVAHDLFKSPAAVLADYILPAAHWLEKPYFSEGFSFLGMIGDYAEANEAAIAPEHGHRTDYELWRDLGRYLDQSAEWPDRVQQLWEQWLGSASITLDELEHRRGPWRDPNMTTGNGQRPYGTVSGKVELRSELLERFGVDALPGYEESSLFREHARDFPLVLTTGGRVIEGFHQNAQQMSAFRKRFRHPTAQVHPETAAAAGIRDGDWVLIETPSGRVAHRAHLTEVVHARVIQADRWWYPEAEAAAPSFYGVLETNINACIDNDLEACDPIMGAWPLRAFPCRLTRLNEPPPQSRSA